MNIRNPFPFNKLNGDKSGLEQERMNAVAESGVERQVIIKKITYQGLKTDIIVSVILTT